MSITFYATSQDSRAILTCECQQIRGDVVYENRAAARTAKESNEIAPVDCENYCAGFPHRVAEFEEPPYVNASNINAHFILETLGLYDQNHGSLDASDFLGRVLLAQAVAPIDEGVPAYHMNELDASGAPMGATMINGGRYPGYLQARLEELEHLATFAIANNSEVLWG